MSKNNIQNIPSLISLHWKGIIQELSKNEWDHFRKYSSVKEKFTAKEFDKEFESVFCHFYRLNGPRGLNENQQKKFFQMIQETKDWNLSEVLRELYKIPKEKLHLSFSSKFLHTHNNELPIYDNNVASVLGLRNSAYPQSFEDRIEDRNAIYEEMKKKVSDLLSDKEINKSLILLRGELKNKKGVSQDITDVKLLDSILWALFSVLNPKKSKKDTVKCLCDEPLCAKCLSVNCRDENCQTHTKEAKEKWHRNRGK